MYGRETRDLIQINFIILNVEPNILAIAFSVCIRKYNIFQLITYNNFCLGFLKLLHMLNYYSLDNFKLGNTN